MLRHTAAHFLHLFLEREGDIHTLQHIATQCNTMQHTAAHFLHLFLEREGDIQDQIQEEMKEFVSYIYVPFIDI